METIFYTPICLFTIVRFLLFSSIPLFVIIAIQILSIPDNISMRIEDKEIKLKRKLDRYGYSKYIIRIKAFHILFFPVWITHKRIYHQSYAKDNPTSNKKEIAFFHTYQNLQEYIRTERENYIRNC